MPYYPNISLPGGQGGGGGTGHFATCTVDFGMLTPENYESSVETVSAAWVTSTSKLGCYIVKASVANGIYIEPTADHDPDDAIIEGIMARVVSITPGVGFDVQAHAPNGSWGHYVITIVEE